jgi:hypothetical protein
MAASAGAHPNETDLAEARIFAKQVKTISSHANY